MAVYLGSLGVLTNIVLLYDVVLDILSMTSRYYADL
jgi:hypothetical protein